MIFPAHRLVNMQTRPLIHPDVFEQESGGREEEQYAVAIGSVEGPFLVTRAAYLAGLMLV
jgi:hypothetical protein